MRIIVCCYSNLRLLVIGERIIETYSMLGSVLIQIAEYVAVSGVFYSLAGSIRISILCTGGADVRGGQLKCDSTRAENRFRHSAKRTSPLKSAGASVQSTTGSRGVLIIGSNAGYTMFRGSVKGTGYPFHSPVSPSLPVPCVTMCHHFSTGLYFLRLK